MRKRAAAAFVMCALAACTFGDLGDFDHGPADAGTPDPNNTNVTPDGSTPETDTDGGTVPTNEAGADVVTPGVITDAGTDAMPSGCDPTAAMLLGNKTDPASQATDQTGGGYVDSFGYVASKAATAVCAFVYLDPPQDTQPSYVGVYTEGNGGTPETLVATAIFDSTVNGWNGAKLDHPVTLTSGQHIWLAIGAPDASVNYRYVQTSCGSLTDHAGTTATNGLANPFVPFMVFNNSCNALAYLTP